MYTKGECQCCKIKDYIIFPSVYPVAFITIMHYEPCFSTRISHFHVHCTVVWEMPFSQFEPGTVASAQSLTLGPHIPPKSQEIIIWIAWVCVWCVCGVHGFTMMLMPSDPRLPPAGGGEGRGWNKQSQNLRQYYSMYQQNQGGWTNIRKRRKLSKRWLKLLKTF